MRSEKAITEKREKQQNKLQKRKTQKTLFHLLSRGKIETALGALSSLPPCAL
jgi:hypothetical protein